MTFLRPAAFTLGLLLPIIIAMYLLKLRRTERLVSSTYLWQQMVRDVEANAPWQRLRRNLLLVLQLLFLISLIITLARPFTWMEGFGGQDTILILDTSASMSATDVSPNRLEAAKDQARRLVDGLADETRITIIAAGVNVQVLASRSRDRQQVHQAIEGIQPGTGGSDLGVALQLASASAARQPDSEIVVLSDGRVTLPGRLSIQELVRYIPIGIQGENQAISLLNLAPAAGGESLTAFAQVINYGATTVTRRIAFYADGQLFNAFDVRLPPGSERAVLAEKLPIATHLIEAQLLSNDQTLDHLPIDDRALAVHRRSDPVKATLISQGNRFLETALSLMPNLETTQVIPGEERDYPDSDLTILDNYIPITTTLPNSNLFIIAPPRSTPYFNVSGIIDAPVPRPANADDPLLNHISLESVNILEAIRVPLPDWAQPVILALDPVQVPDHASPLLFRGEIDNRRIAVLTFDLRHSDLPLQVAFPILLANLTGWLAPGHGGDIPAQISPSTAIAFFIPLVTSRQNLPTAIITRPDGSSVNLEAREGIIVFADTSQLGLYTIDLGTDEKIPFVVNLSSPQESNITPVESLPIPGTSSQQEIPFADRARREWWRIGALLALTLLSAEWLVYQRATISVFFKRLMSAKGAKGSKNTKGAL